VVAKGPPTGELEVVRGNAEITVYGWGGAQVAISNERAATVAADLEELLQHVEEAHPLRLNQERIAKHTMTAALTTMLPGFDGARSDS